MNRTVFDPEPGSFGGRVRRGAVVTGSSQAVVMGCQILSVILLSRLLSPADFGIIAMSFPVIGLLSLFQDFGLTQATVQKPTITGRDVNFLFWANLLISTAVAGLVIIVAPLAAAFYSESRVAPLLTAMSVLIVVQGLGAQHSAILSRLMRFDSLAILSAAGAVAGLATSLAYALVSPTYWALFAGSLASVAVPVAAAWVLSGWRPGLPRLAPDAGRLVRFGAGLTGFNVANFFGRNGDNVLIGRFLGEVQLGLYDRAYKLLLVPLQQATNPLSRVMVPTLSRLADEPERYRRAFLTVIVVVLLAMLPGVVVMIVLAGTLVPFLLGEQWRESAMIFHALGFAGLLQPLNNPAGWLFISQGRAREFMHWGIIGASTAVAAFAMGLPFGVVGVAVAYAISEYLRTPVLWWMVGRRGPIGARHILGYTGPVVLGAHVALAVVFVLAGQLPAEPLLAALAGCLIAYPVTFGVALLFPGSRSIVRELATLGVGGLRRRVGAAT